LENNKNSFSGARSPTGKVFQKGKKEVQQREGGGEGGETNKKGGENNKKTSTGLRKKTEVWKKKDKPRYGQGMKRSFGKREEP